MNNNVSKIVQSAGSISPYQKYSYGKDNLPDVYTMFSNRTQTYTFDSLNRYSKMELSLDKPVTINYVYHLSERNKDSSEKYRTTKLIQLLLPVLLLVLQWHWVQLPYLRWEHQVQ